MAPAPRKISSAARTTSVKIPARTKAMVAEAAKDAGVTPHAWLLQIIEREAERAMRRRRFVAGAKRSLDHYRQTGTAYAADDVHAYFKARAAGKKPARPKPVSRG
ncbi:MAG TPA: hypothetical protein VGH20_06915 [Myxococcales bacterium]